MQLFHKEGYFSRMGITSGWIFLVILLLATFLLKNIQVASDGGYYLLNANLISSGHGYTYGRLDSKEPVPVIERGPIAPFFITLGLKLTPGKLLGPYFVLRSSYVVSIILIALLGSFLFGPKVGIIGGIFCIFFGFYQNRSAIIHLESLFIMWILLSIFLFWKGLVSEKKWLQAFGGVALAIAYLTTEIAVLFLPLPILSWLMIRSLRTRKNLIGIAFFYVAFGVGLLPWLVYLLHFHNSIAPILGRASTQLFHLHTIETVTYTVGGGLSKQASFATLLSVLWNKYLIGVSILAPLWIVGWIWICVRLIFTESRAPYALLALLALPFPIMLVGQIVSGTRQSQGLIFHLISFLPVSLLIQDCSRGFSHFLKRNPGKQIATILLTSMLTLLIILIQIFLGSYPFRTFYQKLVLHDFLRETRIPYVNEDPRYRQAHEITRILQSMVEKGEGILVDDYFLMNAIAFYTKDQYRLYSPPFAIFPPGIKRRHQRKYLESTNEFRCPILLYKNRAGGPRYPDVFRVLTVEELKSFINREGISFIVLSGKQPVLYGCGILVYIRL